MNSRRRTAVLSLMVAATLFGGVGVRAEVPYPTAPPAEDRYAYHRYAFLAPGVLPNEGVGGRLEYSADKTGNPFIDGNPQEQFGVKGPSVTTAWQITTGRPDVVIAVLDSGINWPDRLDDHRRKTYLNRGELPVPQGGPNLSDGRFGGYDVNGDAVFNIDDYAGDTRTADLNGNNVLDPEDLIFDSDFADGVDSDGNGYVDDISGWDFFEDDNDARDEPKYGHGTGEARDSSAEANNGGDAGICPNCMFMPLRVGDSFIADVHHWAEAVLYATDNGANVVQEALGTLNNSRFGQQAADYAYKRGVIIVASAADEEATHHNYPSNYGHTMVVNSVRNADSPAKQPQSYLYLNGCTNFGGHIHVAVPGESCSSEATGRSSGMAGLIYSEALNELDRGEMTRYRRDDGTFAPFVLSADEVKQIFRAGVDDINFSEPAGPTFSPPFSGAPPNNYAITDAIPSERYHSVKGWDQFFGYGRVNARTMVELVRGTTSARPAIPPEADITSPAWFQIISEGTTFDLLGRVAANRAGSYRYKLQWAAGVQPPEYPLSDIWYDVTPGLPSDRTSSYEGVLGQIDTTAVQAAISRNEGWQIDPAREPTSKSMPERFSFRVRVQVIDNFGNLGEDQRQFFVHDDSDLVAGWPKQLEADGASSPVFADINDDGAEELIVGGSNGQVHAFRADGSELPGWPVATDPAPAMRHSASPALGSGEITLPIRGAILTGSALVADLDHDGDVEILAADLEGLVYAWEADGSRRAGFPVSVDRTFSQEVFEGAIRNRFNRVDWGINSAPAASDLDANDGGKLEIVFGANDSHVYAFNDDGTAVPGWPVLLRDPSKVASVDSTTHRMSFRADSGHQIGSKIIVSPSIGDVDGDGYKEVVIGVNEEYIEDPNFSINSSTGEALNQYRNLNEDTGNRGPGLTDPGNGRLYALDRRGSLTPQASDDFPAFPHEQAYLPGWPARIAMLTTELLPYVGTGINGAAPLADLDGDGDLEIGVFSFLGPGYILDHTGSSIWGKDSNGNDITLASERDQFGSASDGADAPAFPSLGGGIFTRLTPAGIAFASPGGGLVRLLDVVLSAHQLGGQDYLLAWDLAVPGGSFVAGFPREVNDLQFITTPSSADISGDGVPEVLGGTAVYDVAAINAAGVQPPGWPKFTGGWSVSVPAVGDPDGDGKFEVAQVTREGWLFLWNAGGDSCGTADWPKAGHDLWNSSNLGTDAFRPGVIKDLSAQVIGKGKGKGKKQSVQLSWTSPGDDGRCGRARSYEVRVLDRPILSNADWLAATPISGAPSPKPAGSPERFNLEASSASYFAVRSLDEAGNLSALSNSDKAGTAVAKAGELSGAPPSQGSLVLGEVSGVLGGIWFLALIAGAFWFYRGPKISE